LTFFSFPTPRSRFFLDNGGFSRAGRVYAPHVLQALPVLAERVPEVRWVVASAETNFYEPRDRKMLEELGLERLGPVLADFWPARGPVWDALARCTFADGMAAVILAEGKNYPREMYNGGTQAGKSGSEEAKASRRKIELAIA
jgi:hypothetical protein